LGEYKSKKSYFPKTVVIQERGSAILKKELQTFAHRVTDGELDAVDSGKRRDNLEARITERQNATSNALDGADFELSFSLKKAQVDGCSELIIESREPLQVHGVSLCVECVAAITTDLNSPEL